MTMPEMDPQSAAVIERLRREGWVVRVRRKTYSMAHHDIYDVRGDASDFDCVDCGRPAAQWSYNRDDPQEWLGRRTDGPPRPCGRPEFYSPRCHRHHRQRDPRRTS